MRQRAVGTDVPVVPGRRQHAIQLREPLHLPPRHAARAHPRTHRADLHAARARSLLDADDVVPAPVLETNHSHVMRTMRASRGELLIISTP